MRALNTNVYVDGTWYGPGDRVPAEVAEKIANPKAWSDDDPPQADRTEQGAAVKQPNRKGPGSGGSAWVEFAASKGVTEKFDSKEALIAHLEGAGLIEKE